MFLKKYVVEIVITSYSIHYTKLYEEDLSKALNIADKAFVLDIFPAREKQENYPEVTSNIIVNNLKNGELISDETWDKLKEYKDAVVLFLSPKQIHDMMSKFEEYLND